MSENEKYRAWCEIHGIVATGNMVYAIGFMKRHMDCGCDYGVIAPELWQRKQERKRTKFDEAMTKAWTE